VTLPVFSTQHLFMERAVAKCQTNERVHLKLTIIIMLLIIATSQHHSSRVFHSQPEYGWSITPCPSFHIWKIIMQLGSTITSFCQPERKFCCRCG